MKTLRRILFVWIVFFVVGGFWFLRAIALPVSDDQTVYRFAIEKGEGVNEISAHLDREGLLRSPFAFETYVWFRDLERKMIAGVYDLRPSLSIRELTRLLTTGETISRERTITILEGWNRKDIAAYLEQEGVAKKEEFLAKTKGYEGRLFPDTYRIFRDASVDDIVQKMLGNFELKVTQDMRQAITRQQRTLDDVLILASILEREVRSDEERALAADLFLRRLAIGMPLQSDATINFITNGKRPQPTHEDLQTESPYNTYKHRGLPPGPIGNPSLSAITAAVSPKSNDYWYYLTTLDTGVAHFSKTYEEHLQKKAKYLR